MGGGGGEHGGARLVAMGLFLCGGGDGDDDERHGIGFGGGVGEVAKSRMTMRGNRPVAVWK